MRLFSPFFKLSVLICLFAVNCYAQNEFFSKREDLISKKPIVASISTNDLYSQDQINTAQNNSYQNNSTEQDSFKYDSQNQNVNIQNEKSIMGNPLGLVTKKPAPIQEVKKEEVIENSAKNEVEKKIDKLSNLDQAIETAKELGENLAQALPSSTEIKKIIRSKEATKQEYNTKEYKF